MISIWPQSWWPRRLIARIAAGSLAASVLAGCVTSEAPVFDGSEQPFGDAARIQIFGMRRGAARDPYLMQLRWTGTRYTVTAAEVPTDNALSFHTLDDSGFIVQVVDGRPGRPVEYAIARPLAEGVYLINPVDEDDADDATREKFCASPSVCRVTTPEQLIGLARATAAKRHQRGGLAIRIADGE